MNSSYIETISTQSSSYQVVCGHGAICELKSLIPVESHKVAIISQKNIGTKVETGLEQKYFYVDDGESAKSIATFELLCRQLVDYNFSKSDLIISVGGGVVTDLAGYLAASYHRGVKVIHVATSLLAQIDAAIGGKCGVNLPEGKNLVGAIWQPQAVICDTNHLETLPEIEKSSGMGELAKYVFIADSMNSNNQLSRPIDYLLSADLSLAIADCVRIKGDVVAADERESTQDKGSISRAILNYGHTLGHGLEATSNYKIKHGHGVAIGILFAAYLAKKMIRIDNGKYQHHLDVIGELVPQLPKNILFDNDEIIQVMLRDKKAKSTRDGNIIVFMLDGENGIEPVEISDLEMLASSLNEFKQLLTK